MLTLNSDTSDQPALNFLEQYPAISQSLFAEVGPNPRRVATVIEPILTTYDRAQGSRYIQAISTGRTAFLATNLSPNKEIYLTEASTSWLIGRSSKCAIVLSQPSISRCHFAIGYHPGRGFYLVDLGSRNGTLINQHRRLTALEKHPLHHGDVIKISNFTINFFLSSQEGVSVAIEDTHFPQIPEDN
jgi:pSer/pThr/pTyr-binding forkhead associated (FHA) protein